jgi:archaemetzincin
MIYLLPIGEVADDILGAVGTGLWRSFGYETAVLHRLPIPASALDQVRKQYNSVAILREVAARVPQGAVKLLGITTVDLFIPMLSFVFGQAQVGGAAALVSLARLHQEFHGIPPNHALFLSRAIKECVHETGHTFGLTHCPDVACPMSLSNTIRQVDDKGDELCGNCSIRLEESITTLRPRLRRAGDKEN